MQFTSSSIAGSGTYQNTTNHFLLLISWGASFTINDPSGNVASGTIAAFVATNSIVLIPPNWKIVNGASANFFQGLFLSFAELVEAVTSQVPQ